MSETYIYCRRTLEFQRQAERELILETGTRFIRWTTCVLLAIPKICSLRCQEADLFRNCLYYISLQGQLSCILAAVLPLTLIWFLHSHINIKRD